MGVGTIGRAARGLFGFVDLITDGIGPREQSQTLQPVLDVFPFLGADTLRSRDAQAAYPAIDEHGVSPALAAFDAMGPPTGYIWLVTSIMGQVSDIPPYGATVECGVTGVPYGLNRRIDPPYIDAGFSTHVFAEASAEYTEPAAAALPRYVTAKHEFERPFVMLPGRQLYLYALATGHHSTGAGVLWSVKLSVLFHQIAA